MSRNRIFLLIGLVILVFAAFFLRDSIGNLLNLTGADLRVSIIHPTESVVVNSGDAVVLLVQVEADSPVSEIQLIVNDEIVGASQADEGHGAVFTSVITWFSSSTGIFSLEVQAVDEAGRGSNRALIKVGVEAVVSAQEDEMVLWNPPAAGEEENNPLGSVQEVNTDGPNAVEQALAEAAVRAGGETEEGAGPAVLEAEQIAEAQAADPEIPIGDEIVDFPPEITFFDVSLIQLGDEVSVLMSAEAVDDFEVSSFEVVGVADRPLESPIARGVTCQSSECSLRETFPISAGLWTFTLRAVDNSGQASRTNASSIEVVEGADGPAVFDHAEAEVDFETLAILDGQNFPLVQGLDLGGEEEAFVSDELMDGCISIEGRNSPSNNVITIQFHCNLLPEEGQQFHFIGEQQIGGPVDSRRLSNVGGLTRQAVGFESLEAGSSHIWNADYVCEANVSYRVFLVQSDDVSAPNEDFLTSSNEIELLTSRCDQDAFGNVSMSLARENDENKVSWTVFEEAPHLWEFGDQPVLMDLYRSSGNADEAVPLIIDGEAIAIFESEVTYVHWDSEIECGMPYSYTLRLHQAGIERARVSRMAPFEVCGDEENFLDGIQIGLSAGYFPSANLGFSNIGHTAAVSYGFEIPQDGELPAGSIHKLLVLFDPRALVDGEGRIVATVDLPPDIFEGGSVRIGGNIPISGASVTPSYNVQLALEVDGEIVAYGPQFPVAAPSSLPLHGIASMRVVGSEEAGDCGGSAQCAIGSWTYQVPPEGADSGVTRWPIASFLLARQLSTEDTAIWLGEVDAVSRQFIDSELNCNPGNVAMTGRYYLYPVTENGLIGSSYSAQFNVPFCDEPFSELVSR